jgi:hypothetical protein
VLWNASAVPSNNTTNYYYSATKPTNPACAYRYKDNGECDLSEPYACKNSSNTVTKVDTTSSTEWQWYCK